MWRALVLVCVLAGSAHADRRLFTRTFEYRTLAEGHTTLTLWHTESRDAWSSTAPQLLEYALQIEHGITDRIDAALYTVLDQTVAVDPADDRSLGIHEVRLQARYRFADRAEWPIDLQLQAELAKQYSARTFDTQLRTVVARDFDKLTGAINLIGIVRGGSDADDSPEFQAAWAAALGYELHVKVSAGIEGYGTLDAEPEAAIGPVVSVAPSRRLWLAVAGSYGLTDETTKLSARALVGIELD